MNKTGKNGRFVFDARVISSISAPIMLKRRSFLAGSAAFAAVGFAKPAAFAVAEALPAYYHDYLGKIAAKIEVIGKTPGVTGGFFFFTDPHVPANRHISGRLIAELLRRTKINKVFCGGDIPAAFGSKAELDASMAQYNAYWSVPIQAAGGILYNAKGNHDFTIRTDRTSKDGWTYSSRTARDFYMASNGCGAAVRNKDDSAACYYYADDTVAKIRYIVADTTDSASDDPHAYWGVKYGIGEKQLTWLAENAFAAVPDGFSVVVIHHIPVVPIVGEDGEAKTFAGFRRLLEAYQNRGPVTLFGHDYDFSAAKGTILLDLTGHHHSDRMTYCNGILHVTEACDAAYRDYITRSPFSGVLPEKSGGTIFEQTFDVLQFDPQQGLVYTTRVGGGQDRVFHAKSVRVNAGGTLKLVAEKLGGEITWVCYDGDDVQIDKKAETPERYWTFRHDHASIDADGTLHTLAPGDVTVIALDENFNKEIFGVKVGDKT